MDYNKTINLPKTDFPMRAGLPKREPEMLKRWEDMDLYNELLKKNEGKPRFSLHDGPPFSNGSLHMGHALNKSLKDIIVRSYAMRGRYTPYIPGWDNHGMPIESAIIKEQKLNRKKMSVAEFRTACHNYAQKYIDIQMEGFKRMGVLGDWEHPYKTMDPGFEAEEVKVFGSMYRKGYIYKGLKPVYWCPHDETALAEAEIEYQDDPCTTVYVKFRVKDDLGRLSQYGDLSNMYFVIWTTTIWTLPGNLAIAVHPRESYVLVKADNGELYIVAEALCAKVMQAGGFDHYEIVKQFRGQDFEYMKAQHPFLDKESLLCCAEYVTMDSGTGCVHTAPGFGADDYERYKVELVVPVDDQGRHTDYAGKYAGLKTEESNPVILADLKESGALFASEEIVHSYPHCWRCKKPIIFRATPQWFCSVDSFKDEAVAACDDVRWLPAWGKDRMISMIRERADWCISRQRRWGLPIPVFYCADCGKPIVTDETIEAVSRLFGEKGSNAWYEMEAKDILPEDFACPHCGSRTGFTKEEIATVSKVFGVVMTLAGAFVGGIVTMRLGILKTMAVGAVLAAVTNLLFAALAGIGHNVGFLIFTVSADNLAAGLASAAFIAYLSSLTNKAYSATQYALFSSLMLLLPKFIAGFSGVMVESLGYQGFFLLTASMGVPVILLVWWVSRQARARELMSGGRAEK